MHIQKQKTKKNIKHLKPKIKQTKHPHEQPQPTTTKTLENTRTQDASPIHLRPRGKPVCAAD
jgi:hypothetical protein